MLFEETELECEVRGQEKLNQTSFMSIIDILEGYNLIKIERNKKDPKLSMVRLNVSLQDLASGLNSFKEKQSWSQLLWLIQF